MEKIRIEISENELKFSYSAQKTNTKINNKEIIIDKNISKKEIKMVLDILDKSKNKIQKITIEKFSITETALKIIENIKSITTINFEEKTNFSKETYNLINNLKIKIIEIYSAEKEILKLLKDKNITIVFKNSNSYISEFMAQNDFNTYEDLYNKKNITFENEITEYDLADYQNFLKVNENLETINIKKYDDKSFSNILAILINSGKQNIKINIYENNGDVLSKIKKLKAIQKKYKKQIKMKIIFSKEYKKKNRKKKIFQNFILLLMVLIIISVLAYFAYAFIAKKQNEKVGENIQAYKKEIENKEEIEIPEAETKEKETVYNKKYSKIITELQKINNETVGWITVNNTKIDYPVVKHSDNSFYLNHDFEKKNNMYGWVFMDYRNNTNSLDSNTIIYGHDSGNVTFGTLYKVLNKSWYTNKNNQIITFNTANESGNFQIFSIYKVNETSDYLTTNFQNQTEYSNFINTITNRSIYNFGIKVNTNDKILTLSTCYGDTQRLVVHAKKIS